MVGGAAEAFGWVPGVGDKLRSAHASIKKFREDANAELSQIQTHMRFTADIDPAMRNIAKLREASVR